MPPRSSPTTATVAETRVAIDASLRAHGGAHATYSCKSVSWDDVARGDIGSSLSCLGRNITDTYLKSRNGASLFTVRPSNWDEKLGVISASDVALLVGNVDNPPSSLRNITLLDFLKTPAKLASAYESLPPSLCLHDEKADKQVSIRFQTVFLPVETTDASSSRQTFQFAAEAYNYNTTSNLDPRNLVLLATTQGIALQADGVGAKRLLHHAVQPDGTVMQHWLEAERSDHAVGGQQKETVQERASALQRGKAAAGIIGIKAMGTRFNCLLTIQIPLLQMRRYQLSPNLPKKVEWETCKKLRRVPVVKCAGRKKLGTKVVTYKTNRRPPIGQSNAARVSRGDAYGKFSGLQVISPKRNATEHVTVTVVFYNTVAGGVPSSEAAIKAVSDMEALFEACTDSGRLSEARFDFMKHDLTVEDAVQIAGKISTQPVIISDLSNIAADSISVDDVESLLMRKCSEFEETMSAEKMIELRLLVHGALKGNTEALAVFGNKITGLTELVSTGQVLAARKLLEEVRLVIKGALP